MECLAARGLGPAAIVISTSQVNPVPVEETAAVMARFSGAVPIAIVPRFETSDGVGEAAPDLTTFVL